MGADKQHAHELIDRLDPGKIAGVVHLLEVLVQDDDEALTGDDRRVVAASREYFRTGGQGVPFEQVVAECGFTMDQVRKDRD